MTAGVRAARVHAWNTPPVIDELPHDEPGAGETLVALQAASVAHIDLTVASGTFAHRPELPYVPGADGAGVVERSESLEPGTPVRIRGGGVGLERAGTWRELGAFPDEALEPLPDGVDPAVAATFFVPCATALAAVEVLGEVRAGEAVAVVGAAGAVGTVAVQLALRAGAARVLGVEPSPERQAAIPADAERAGELTEIGAFDLLVDMAGGAGLAERLRAVRPEGRLVLVGYAAGTRAELDLPAFLAADVRLVPVNLIRWERRLREPTRALLELVRRGELFFPLARFPFDEVAGAVEALRAGGGGRVAVVMDGAA